MRLQGFKDDPRLSCLNLDCGGFVQLAEHTVVGGKITAAMDSFLDFEIYLSTDVSIGQDFLFLFISFCTGQPMHHSCELV